MECTVYNPQKGRLETLDIEITATIWPTSPADVMAASP